MHGYLKEKNILKIFISSGKTGREIFVEYNFASTLQPNSKNFRFSVPSKYFLKTNAKI